MHWISLGLYPGWCTSARSADDLNRLGSYLGAMAQSHGDQGPDVAPRASDLAKAEELGPAGRARGAAVDARARDRRARRSGVSAEYVEPR
jgi:hypothetical protein